MKSNHLENGYATYSIDDGIMHITYKTGVYIDLNAAVKIVEDRLSLQNDRPYPVLCDIHGVKAVDKSARDYLAIEGSVLVSAVAFIVKPPVSTWLSEFYLTANKPAVPTRAFTEPTEAKRFLNQFKNKRHP
ncbi:hypothetical protein [Snuella lapsa]|uniref:DUF7793 domain-containing protein n=1 Tax=Snuella lapsa TaxID=870481 RepID=A0ABP6XXS7_9FLAO